MKHARTLIIGIVAFVAVIGIVMIQFKTKTLADSSSSAPVKHEPEVPLAFNDLPVKGMVTMIDLGATECVPCKMMAPIMEKLEVAYRDKAVIAFIDVWKNREQARRFGIRAIPTQIFYDQNGKEVYRHQGFMSEKAIVQQLTRMGVEKPVLKPDKET